MKHRILKLPRRRMLVLVCLPILVALFTAINSRAAIVLEEISATAQADGTILVHWRTATELDIAGFNLYRAETAAGPWDTVIDTEAARGDGSTPTDYNFVDEDVTLGVTYYYILEAIQSDGSTNRFTNYIVHATAGDVSTSTPTPSPSPTPSPTVTATPTVQQYVYLPMVVTDAR